MKDLVLEQKTGFMTTLPFQIYDVRGNVFYDDSFCRTIAEGRPLKFNMPAGAYKYNGNFIKLDKPVTMDLPAMPLPELCLIRLAGTSPSQRGAFVMLATIIPHPRRFYQSS